jgi:hypothetical protein
MMNRRRFQLTTLQFRDAAGDYGTVHSERISIVPSRHRQGNLPFLIRSESTLMARRNSSA